MDGSDPAYLSYLVETYSKVPRFNVSYNKLFKYIYLYWNLYEYLNKLTKGILQSISNGVSLVYNIIQECVIKNSK